MPDKNLIAELAVVTAVGFGLAKLSESVPVLNDRKILTRTALYTLGYFLATKRPEGGYKMLGGS